jgi:Putative lumazine-binding
VGTAATAKIEFYEGDELHFIDYLSLLKFDDGWKIVSKIAYAIPKEKNDQSK